MDKPKKKCVIVLSHSNYKIRSNGTEKYISQIVRLLQNDGREVLQIFPLVDLNRKINRTHKGRKKYFAGINYNGVFAGIVAMHSLKDYLDYKSAEDGLCYEMVHLQHLDRWDKDCVNNLMSILHIPIILFIHDYYMICPYMTREDGGLEKVCNKECRTPNEIDCRGCKYQMEGGNAYDQYMKLMVDLQKNIVKIIAPSDIALANWQKGFGFLKADMVVRPHLSYDLKPQKRHLNDKIRIAYLGTHHVSKGYREWLKILEILNSEQYEFYNYSKTSEDHARVNNVYIDFRDKNSPSMVEQLKKYNIDIAFLWCMCMETYSYTTYEAYEAGCYIVTNEYSGNIAEQTKSAGCGKVFKNLDECIEWLQNSEDVRTSLNEYISKNMIPVNVESNKSRNELYPQECFSSKGYSIEAEEREKRYKNPKNLLLSLIYRYFRANR